MIEDVSNFNNILDFIKKFFSQYICGNDPYEKIKIYKIDQMATAIVSKQRPKKT